MTPVARVAFTIGATLFGGWRGWHWSISAKARRVPSPRLRPEPTCAAVADRVGVRRHRALATIGALVAAVVGGPAVAAAAIVVVMLGHRYRVVTARRRRMADVWTAAPDVVSLMQLAVTSGLTPYLALAEVTPLLPAVLRPAFETVLDDVRHGRRLADALGRLLVGVGEPLRPLVAALTASEHYGVALLPALDVAAIELRRRRRQVAEARARRLPVLLSFPLVCCVLPAFVCLSIAPVAVGAIRSLRPPSSTVPSAPSSGSPPVSTNVGGSP